MMLAVLYFVSLAVIYGVSIPIENSMECTPDSPRSKEEVCCKLPEISKHHDDQWVEAFSLCEKTTSPPSILPTNDSEKPQLYVTTIHHSHFDCVSQCVFKTLGFLTDSNELHAEALKEFVQEHFDGKWSEVGVRAVVKCLGDAQTMISKTSKCRSGSDQFMDCVIREAYLNCPVDHWVNSDICRATKDKLEKCPYLVPPMAIDLPIN